MQLGDAVWPVAHTLEALSVVWSSKVPYLPSPAAGVFAAATHV